VHRPDGTNLILISKERVKNKLVTFRLAKRPERAKILNNGQRPFNKMMRGIPYSMGVAHL
jgi:hypothetical protein